MSGRILPKGLKEMKNIKKLSKKTLAVILSVAIILVSLPLMLIPI